MGYDDEVNIHHNGVKFYYQGKEIILATCKAIKEPHSLLTFYSS
jgi:hypothetical protein